MSDKFLAFFESFREMIPCEFFEFLVFGDRQTIPKPGKLIKLPYKINLLRFSIMVVIHCI